MSVPRNRGKTKYYPSLKKTYFYKKKAMRNYPLGIQTFSEIIEQDFFYIDKTQEIYQLLRGKYYFYRTFRV